MQKGTTQLVLEDSSLQDNLLLTGEYIDVIWYISRELNILLRRAVTDTAVTDTAVNWGNAKYTIMTGRMRKR